MGDAYRTSAFMCPVCEGATLREYKERLVCDQCQGMMLSTDDFADSIREIDGSQDPIAVTDTDATKRGCPHCSVPMKECKVTLGSLSVAGAMHCATHGIWMPRKQMTSAFARASRRGGFAGMGATGGARSRFGGGGSGADASSIIANMPSAHSGMSGAMAGIASAFGGGGPASGGLAISHWQSRRPRAHTIYVSAHKDQQLGCPACKKPLAYWGDRWRCAHCPGLFVETAALVGMVSEMVNGPWELPPLAGKPGERVCSICESPMVVEVLEGVTVDRCEHAHGVWFDEHELEQVLHHASTPHGGLGTWIKRLFGRG
ncbi:MAG TPA: zf-TFIIB domain-containing protein [Kofleriaceae bacterium]|nr:zf-TFIIB domain-containing protein [Kofleriaceae bacterium]